MTLDLRSDPTKLQDFSSYQAALSASVYPIKLDLHGNADGFVAHIDDIKIGHIGLVRAHANAGFKCNRQSLRKTDYDGSLLLKLQERGRTSYVQHDRLMHCERDCIALLSGGSPIQGEQFGSGDALVLKIPGEMVSIHAPQLPGFVSTVIEAQQGAGKLLALTLRELWDCASGFSTFQSQVLPISLLSLITAAFVDSDISAAQLRTAMTDARLDRVRDVIRKHLDDPDFSIARLCVLAGLSRSCLYELTRATGTTVERFIFEIRLDEARRMLHDPNYDRRTLTDIAYSVGFQDFSHFSRRFKLRFDSSPRDYRARESASRVN